MFQFGGLGALFGVLSLQETPLVATGPGPMRGWLWFFLRISQWQLPK